jgi:hypothetical protein
MVAAIVGYGTNSLVKELNRPFVWESKEIVDSQQRSGKFIDFPFEKKVSFGFAPIIFDGTFSNPLTHYGEIGAKVASQF